MNFSVCGKILNGQVNLNTVTLWAMWLALGPQKINSCNEAIYGETYIIDGYETRKLKDNKCWTINDVASSVSYSSASNYCTNKWKVPTRQEFFNLLQAYSISYSYSYGGGSCSTYNIASSNLTQLIEDLSLYTSNEMVWLSGTCYNQGRYGEDTFQRPLSTITEYQAGQLGSVRCISI